MAYHNAQLAEPDFSNVAVLHSYWQLAVDPSDSPNVAIPAGLTPRDLIGYGEDATEKGANYMLSARFEFIARVMQSVYHAALLWTPSSYVKDTEALFQTAYLGEPKVFAAVPMSRYRDFDHTWACFLGNVASQWDFLRIACAVLLS
ncbi:hypothetical protein PHLCEN_2v7024 [Hermanssonia centrifuga]|uniref:Uncharacterized protein n=1 Tax=Hermanssonia centrifuga TaxID=98765 RepID=A0A2R6NXW3_9APHY|nr:hypothetical protein PHLCEN_2v7024 [Hermanssonia centrifuga]